MTTDIPPNIDTLLHQLDADPRFELYDKIEHGLFNNFLWRYKSGTVHIQVVRDRGWWTVDVSLGRDQWHDPGLFEDYLDGDHRRLDFADLDTSVRIVSTRLDEILHGAQTDPMLPQRIDELYEEVKARRRAAQ